MWKMHFLINYIEIKYIWILSTLCTFQNNLCLNLDSCKLVRTAQIICFIKSQCFRKTPLNHEQPVSSTEEGHQARVHRPLTRSKRALLKCDLHSFLQRCPGQETKEGCWAWKMVDPSTTDNQKTERNASFEEEPTGEQFGRTKYRPLHREMKEKRIIVPLGTPDGLVPRCSGMFVPWDPSSVSCPDHTKHRQERKLVFLSLLRPPHPSSLLPLLSL